PFEPFGIPLMGGLGGEEIEWMQVPANLFHGWAGWLLLLMIVGHIVMVARHRKAADQTDVLPRMWG
ncbi:MAG TPA: cytochrome B, partial [Alcanivorax sp.]|nr:cytochrome B [Alcanivorax sp.]